MKTLIYQGSKLIYESQHIETHDIGEVIYIGQEYIVSRVKVGKNCLSIMWSSYQRKNKLSKAR